MPNTSFVALTVALILFLGNCFCPVRVSAGEANPPPAVTEPNAPKASAVTVPAAPPAADPMSGLDWSATKQSFLDEKGAVVLSGSAYVHYQGIKMEADNIVFYKETRELYAEGHCRMVLGETEMEAAAAYIDVDSDSGYLIEAVVKVTAAANAIPSNPSSKNFGIRENQSFLANQPDTKSSAKHTVLPGEEPTYNRKDPYGTYVDTSSDPQARVSFLMKADKLIRHSKLHYSTENAFMTNDEMAHPIYGLKTASTEFFLHEVPDPKNPGKLTLAPEKVIAKKTQVQIFGYNLIPFPTITYDMTNKREYVSAIQGKSGRWGYYVLTRFGYDMGPAKGEMQTKNFQFTHAYVDLDERTKRGPAVGVELGWQTKGYQTPGAGPEKLYYEYGTGYVRTYGESEIQVKDIDDLSRASADLERRVQPKIDGFQRIRFDTNLLFLARRRLDNAAPPSFNLERHDGDTRGAIDVSEHLPIRRFMGVDNIQFDLVFNRQSDRDFNLEYFPNNYNRNNQSEALASIRKATDDYNLEFIYRGNPEPFDSSPPRSPFEYGTFTGYEPAATYSTLAKDVGYGVYMSTEEQAARMRRYFERDIYNQSNFNSERLYAKVDFARPTQEFCFLNVTPHIGAQGNLYDNSRDSSNSLIGSNDISGKNIAQGAITYGLDLDTRIYGTYCDVKNDALGIDGLRHVIEPRISYRGVSNTINDPVKILDFDQYDDLMRSNVVTFALDQTFQTHTPTVGGGERTLTVGGFDTSLDLYPSNQDQQRLLGGDSFGTLKVEGFLHVLDVVRLSGGVGFNPQNFRDETAQWKVTIDPHDRWRLSFAERYNYTDPNRAITGSDQYHFQAEYELSDRWGISYEQVLERKKSLQLIKGKNIEYIGLTRHFGPFDASINYMVDKNLNDQGVSGAFRPTIVSRNLILPENDPLVNPTQVSGDFDGPETRNFDPFQIMRQQRLQKNQNRKANSPGGGGDVPAPPQSTSMLRSKNNDLADTVDLDKMPNAKPVQKKAPVDSDEWALPASMPTSARDR